MKLVFFVTFVSAMASGMVLADEFESFERDIRPLLVEKCIRCHNDQKHEGGLNLTSRSKLLRGGESGKPIVLSDPDSSLLLKAIAYVDELRMPPDAKLSDLEIDQLKKWVRAGVPWPNGGISTTKSESDATSEAELQRQTKPNLDRSFWSFRPIQNELLPQVKGNVSTAIDTFIQHDLEVGSRAPAPQATRRELARRLCFDLTGLPPTATQCDDFEVDDRPDAYDRLADRHLAAPAFGERWGRHWLDLVRYTDSFDKRLAESNSVADCHAAWRYRDWVIQSWNVDLRFDQFVQFQIAGDTLTNGPHDELRRNKLIATTMLAIGSWGGGDADKEKLLTDIVDDQIDVVTRGLLGVSLSCARCHDHKFDPFSTEDYYAMAGIFFSSHIVENIGPKTLGPPLLRIPLESETEQNERRQRAERASELTKKISSLVTSSATRLAEREIRRIDEYLVRAWRDAHDAVPTTESKIPVDGDRQLIPAIRTRVTDWIKQQLSNSKSTFQPDPNSVLSEWCRFVASMPRESEVADRARTMRQLLNAIADQEGPLDPNRVLLRQLTAEGSPWFVKSSDVWDQFPKTTQVELREWNEELAAIQHQPSVDPPYTHGCREGGCPGTEYAGYGDARIHIRGRYDRLGAIVPRGLPKLFAHEDLSHDGSNQTPFVTEGSGRRELASWLVAEENPLTSRVFVNRLWMHLMGRGIVRTPGDFGTRGERPTHPELLDHLAFRLMHDDEWSTKRMIRAIVLSDAYQRSSGDEWQTLPHRDNRWWERAERKRLNAESIRDALLTVTGELDLRSGGPGERCVGPPVADKPGATFSRRRSVYLWTARSDRSGFRELFDAADPSAIVHQRRSTNSAAQSLFFVNDPLVDFVVDTVANECSVIRHESWDRRRSIVEVYRRILARSPSDAELQIALDFIRTPDESQPDGRGEDSQSADHHDGPQAGNVCQSRWKDWCRLLLSSNEFLFVD